jgi:hypothetical protein
MKLVISSYFDLGYSLGFTDDVFDQKRNLKKSKELGITNPLGNFLLIDLANDEELLNLWKVKTHEELGKEQSLQDYGLNSFEHREELTALLNDPPLSKVEVYLCSLGIGIFYIEVLNDAIPVHLIRAFYHFMEWGAYDPEFGQELNKRVSKEVEGIATPEFKKLTTRGNDNRQNEDKAEKEGIFPSFNLTIPCFKKEEAEITKSRFPTKTTFTELKFDYHGSLHFNWAVQILEPRENENASIDDIEKEFSRLIENIIICESFLAICQFMHQFFNAKIAEQLNTYSKEEITFNNMEETLALKHLGLYIANICQYRLVAEAEEDQTFFEEWEKYAKIKPMQELINQQCQKMYEFQNDIKIRLDEKKEKEEKEKEKKIKRILFSLTVLTFISVVKDFYDFVYCTSSPSASFQPGKFWPMLILLGVVVFIIWSFFSSNLFFRKKQD